MTSRARAQLVASITVVYGLAALAIVAPTATLALLTGILLWGMFHRADRSARSWDDQSSRASHPASRGVTRRDA